MKKIYLLILSLAGFSPAFSQTKYHPDQDGILYVDSSAAENPADYNWIGDQWKKAITSLSGALKAADSLNEIVPGTVKQIWVAKGTYQPRYSAEWAQRNTDGGRNNSFVLPKSVKLYGGFAGGESSPEERDSLKMFGANRTILSGNLGMKNNANDNAYHVVLAVGDLGEAALNGFIITEGNAFGNTPIEIDGNGTTASASEGGGLYCRNVSGFVLERCVLEGNVGNKGGGIFSDVSSLQIKRTRFTNNTAVDGGALFISDIADKQPEISESVFFHNQAADKGGAACITYAGPIFNACSFLNNQAKKGGALCDFQPQGNADGSVVRSSVFSLNKASDWGGGVYSNSSTNAFINCLFSENTASYGGALNLDNSSETGIYNCTIVKNRSTASFKGGGSISVYQSVPAIRNSIIWDNSSPMAYSHFQPDYIQYSLVQSDDYAGTTGHNLSEDPLFVDTASGNYQLKTNSPVLNKGVSLTNLGISLPGKDLAGKARLIGAGVEFGAYEIQNVAPDKNGIFYVNIHVSGGNGSGDSWANAFKRLSDALLATDQLNQSRRGTVKEIWVAKGTYYPLYSAEDGHRSKSHIGSFSGSFYPSDNAFVLPAHVKIYGGFTGTETSPGQRDISLILTDNRTILDGRKEHEPYAYNVYDKSYHVVIAAGVDSALLDGFVIQNGNAVEINAESIQVNGQPVYRNVGAGLDIENSSVTLRHCKINDNYAVNVGGGLHVYNSSFTITDCDFSYNKAVNYGGAISLHNESTLPCFIANSSFLQNSTSGETSIIEGGGAIYNKSEASLSINSCTFKDNSVSTKSTFNYGGAIFNDNSSPHISYSRFENNISAEGGAIGNSLSSPVIDNCLFKSNTAVFLDKITSVKGGAGGAIYNNSSTAHIDNSSFFNNQARNIGGGVANVNKSSARITGCVFKKNHILDPALNTETTIINGFPVTKIRQLYLGGDVYNVNSKADLINVTVIPYSYPAQSGSSSYYPVASASHSQTNIINSIFWGNEDFEIIPAPGSSSGDSKTEVSYSIIQMQNGSVADGEGNLNKDPDFINPAKDDYQLKQNSPAIGAGTIGISSYHLPDSDLAGNPRVVDGKINIGAYGSLFVHPTNLTATYDGEDSVLISWETPLQGDESFVDGDKFQLERSTDSTFESKVKIVTSGIKYAADQKSYSIREDITDISGGLILYYRLTRTMSENQSWQRPALDTARIHLIASMKGIKAQSLVTADGSVKGEVSWQPYTGVWPQGTQFSLIKKNKTDGTQEIISIGEDSARAGHFIDDNIPTCKEIRYTIAVKLGNHFTSPAEEQIPDSILTKSLALITDLTASKGYYPDRTNLRWSTTGSYDHYVVNRKVYGSEETMDQIATVDGKGLQNITTHDDNGTPGVYYQYFVTGLAQCSNVTLHSDTIRAIGFRSPTGTVYGRITYEKGGGAVRDAMVRMESTGHAGLGKSVYLDGQATSRLMIDSLHTNPSDSAFTISLWIKPDDSLPENQTLFTREGQYALGFDSNGKLYFEYNGEKILTSYKRDTIDGWSHITAVHKRDSLILMVNENGSCGVSRKKIYFQHTGTLSPGIYIGSNSDGDNFKGYMDEMRLWNAARDSVQIAKDYSRLLTGGEPDLLAYWRFDATIKDQFYDMSHRGEQYNRNDGTMNPAHVTHSDLIPSVDKLSLKAYTDSTGNYTITGIPYTGINGTTYAIAPILGTHFFDPVSTTRIFSSGSSTFTLDFKDKSSYLISGYVTYENTDVPVKDVRFKVDGTYAFTGDGNFAQTNEKGYFEISVPVGKHTVQAVKTNHVFANDGKIISADGGDVNYQKNMADVRLFDSTTIRFIGRVAGGAVEADYPVGFSLSKNILGDEMAITLALKSGANYKLNNTGNTITHHYRHEIYSNQQEEPVQFPDSTLVKYEERRIIIHPDPTTGEFEADLIPADFQVTDVTVSGGLSLLKNPFELNLNDSVISKTKVHERTDSLFDPATEKSDVTVYEDTVKYNASYIFTYRVDPVISVQQSMNPGNPNTVPYFGNVTYRYSTLGGDHFDVPIYNKEKHQYTFGFPGFRQNTQYGLKITSFEAYPYHNKDGSIRDTTYVPSQGGVATITNDLKAGPGSPDTVHLRQDGTAYYQFIAGEPELMDGIGLKGFGVSVQIGSQYYSWNQGKMLMAYIFGGRPTGQDFTTNGPTELIGILRDPPGSASYSYIKKGSAVNLTRSFTTVKNQSSSINTEISSAPKIDYINGVGVAVATEINTVLKANVSLSDETHWKDDSTFITSTVFENDFQTSSDPSFAGAPDDVFIGRATDITYGTTLALVPLPYNQIKPTDRIFYKDSIAGFAVVQRTGLHAGESFKTLFAYPQYFIINNLIPNLIKIRNSILAEGSLLTDPQTTANEKNKIFYVSKIDPSDSLRYGAANNDKSVFKNKAVSGSDYWDGPSYTIYFPRDGKGTITVPTEDTIMSLDQSIQRWKDWLSENEKAKVNGEYNQNYSFGSGATVDHSRQTTSDTSVNKSFSWVVSGGLNATKGFKINNVGLLITVDINGSGGGDSSRTTTYQNSTTVGFHLEETGSDYMTVDVGQDTKNFNLFRTKGGVTSCPYEGATETQYYQPGTPLNQPTVQREMPEITVDKPIVSGIAANRKASYTIHLKNASSVKGDIYFGLKVIDKSNPYGARLYLDGTALGAGRDVLIPAGETLTKTITLEKGPDSMNYNNIQVILHSTCQYNPVVYAHNIADTISLSAHFLPACSDIHLSSPTDQWLLNTGAPVNEEKAPYLPIVLDKYDLNNSLFNHVELQYKPATSSGWVTAMKFYTDSSTYKGDVQGGAKTILKDGKETNYQLVMNDSYTDGQYDIRAVSVCMDNGQVVAETPSNTVSGIKDVYTPRLFGNPEPANGILGIGDNVKLTFNEPVDAGFLNHNNFTVRAVKNNSALDSLVSLQLDGENDYAETEFEKNMTGKDFTVAMWIMPDKKRSGTLFSQGNKNESIELSLTNDYYLHVIAGNKTYQSNEAVPYLPGQWVHLALVYHAADSSVKVFYNFKKAFEIPKAAYYKGVGPFVFGKSIKEDGDFFAGKMRNVRVWTKTLTSLQLQKNGGKLLSGSENNLLACYPMSHGKGHLVYDKAHGNNAAFNGSWKTQDGKSVSFKGNGYVKLNTSQAVITPEMDFTIGLWFKAKPDQANATLISSGKGNGEDLDGSANLYALGFENGKLTFWNNNLKIQAEDNYLDDNWHHVVIAANRNTGTAQLYVDGALKKYFDADNLGGLASTFTYLGARAYHTATDSSVTHFDQFFKGDIDEVRIWNTYLNSTLVTKDDNVKLSGNETGLLAYYPFEKHLNYNGIWSTEFTPEDQKIQRDANNRISPAVLKNAEEDNDKAPLKAPGPEEDLKYDFVVNKDAIIFNFTGGVDEMKAIDKSIVTFTATDIRDRHGNLLASPITWTAYINQNPLTWSDESLNLSKKLYAPETFETYIVNSGGKEEPFHIGNLPPWLTADIHDGTVPPDGRQKITFTVNKGLNVGSYDDMIEMTNDNQQTQSLSLNVKVNGKEPDWKVDPNAFEYNMSLFGKVRINGIFSSNPDDEVAAFMNGKCVGVARNEYLAGKDLWYVLLTIYSDDLDNNPVEFRIWDAGTGKIYQAMPSIPVVFTSDTILGTSDRPVLLDGEEMLFQNIDLNKGWNWISFNLFNTNLSHIGATLSNGKWNSGDMVKHDTAGFDQYSQTEGWQGTLSKFDNRFLYKLKAANSQVLSTSGNRTVIDTMHINVSGGRWSYISYLPQVNMTVEEALADYDASEQDVIKSQTGFAMYSKKNGWVGNLTYLEPGKGYMLYRKEKSNTRFTYPVLSGSLSIHRESGNNLKASARLNPYQVPVPGNYDYADNMTVIASTDNTFTLLPNDRIVASTGADLRGEARKMTNPLTGKASYFFTISGKQSRLIHFEVIRQGKVVATTEPVLGYQSNGIMGSLKQPFMLHFSKPEIKAGIFPNPFHKSVTIQVSLSAGTHQVQMEIYDVNGKEVIGFNKQTIQTAYYRMVWDGRNGSGVSCGAGVYFIHLRIDGKAYIYKVIKL